MNLNQVQFIFLNVYVNKFISTKEGESRKSQIYKASLKTVRQRIQVSNLLRYVEDSFSYVEGEANYLQDPIQDKGEKKTITATIAVLNEKINGTNVQIQIKETPEEIDKLIEQSESLSIVA